MMPGIPYEEIDVEIRRLVRLMNAVPGIRTVGSCAGHLGDAVSSVSFLAADLAALRSFVSRLPFHGTRAKIWTGRRITEGIFVLTYFGAGRLTHELRVTGSPRYARLRLIGRIEAALVSPP